jgi:DedD protein
MPPDQPIEQEIQFKKRARRRLVGAVALVLLMVTILPMVLDDRAAKNPLQEIAITIPSQDGVEFTSKVMPVGPITPVPTVSPEPKLDKDPINETSPTKAVEPLPPVKAETLKPAKPITKPIQDVTPKLENSKTISDQNLPAGKLPEQNSDTKGGAYSVQIGVFSDAANVKKLQQKLQNLGYKSYSEKMNTPKGEKIRLRAGPFADSEQADSALLAIKDAGMSGLVVLNK